MEIHELSVGCTLTPVGAQLRQKVNGVWTPVDLTGKTVSFKMTDYLGADVVAETSTHVTVVDEADGLVKYDFQEGDIETPGTYYAWFFVYDGVEKDSYPSNGREFVIRVFSTT